MSEVNRNNDAQTLHGHQMVSLLFIIASPSVSVRDGQIVIPDEAQVVAFTERPNRGARTLPGGIAQFARFFQGTDFTTDPPNVTFAATDGAGREVTSVLELGTPVLGGGYVGFPILRPIGDQTAPPPGAYANASLVVDNLWSVIGDVVGTAGAGLGALLSCTLGEVGTAGLDTGLCAAAAVATVGGGLATIGQIKDELASEGS